jgi:hypothetical protein
MADYPEIRARMRLIAQAGSFCRLDPAAKGLDD